MTKSVTFTGHRYIPQSKRSDLCTKLEKAIMENHSKGVRNFLCGMLCKALHNMPYVH